MSNITIETEPTEKKLLVETPTDETQSGSFTPLGAFYGVGEHSDPPKNMPVILPTETPWKAIFDELHD